MWCLHTVECCSVISKVKLESFVSNGSGKRMNNTGDRGGAKEHGFICASLLLQGDPEVRSYNTGTGD